MSDKKIGLLYLGLHRQVARRFGLNSIIKRKDFFLAINRHWILPKELRALLIKEMEDVKLIEVIGRDNIKILPNAIDLDKEEIVKELQIKYGMFDDDKKVVTCK